MPATLTDSVVGNHESLPASVDESFKQYLDVLDQVKFNGDVRKRLERIALLDSELDKLHRMNVELTKNAHRRSRRRESTKDKDPLLRENENLQNDLRSHIRTLKVAMMNVYPSCLFNQNSAVSAR